MNLPRLSLLVSCLLLASVVALKSWEPRIVEDWQNRIFDFYQVLTPRPYQPAPVRIVDIDDASLDRIGQWPWPRTVLATLVDRLKAAGAAAIAFDIVFAEPDRTSPKQILPLWGKQALLQHELSGLPDHDEQFARAIARMPVATGFVLTHDGNHIPAAKSGMAVAGGNPGSFLPAFEGSVTPLPILEKVSTGNGALNSQPDHDGMLRRLPLLFRLKDAVYPSLSVEALRLAQGAHGYIVKTAGASGESGGSGEMLAVKIGNIVIPTDRHGSQWLYYSLPERARYIPAWQVLEGRAGSDKIKGNIVLVGTSAAGLKDIRTTPLNPAVPGVEVFAQGLEQALLGITLSRPDWIKGAEIVLMVVAGVLLLAVNSFLTPVWGLFFMAAMLAAAFATSCYVFAAHRILIEPVMPALAVAAVYLSDALARYIRTERERRQIRAAFAQYVSSDLVEELARHPDQLILGGENRRLSVMFCDMKDFTTISEHLPPLELTRLVSRFLTPMTDIILAHQGTIDKYIGDSVMAFWNAPLQDNQHAVHAAKAALAMQEALHRLNVAQAAEMVAKGQPVMPIYASIGINTGECCVGNMGTLQRFNYSALGDSVNLAARLQAQCRHYGVDILLGETVTQEVQGMALLELDLIRVKGKQNATRIYGLLGDDAMATHPAFVALSMRHGALMEAYYAGLWDQAEEALQQCVEAAEPILPLLRQSLYMRFRQRIAALQPGGATL